MPALRVAKPRDGAALSLGRVRQRTTLLVVEAGGYANMLDVAGLQGQECVVVLNLENDRGRILAVTEQGYGKVTPVDRFRLQSRGGKGVRLINNADSGALAALLVVHALDDVVLQTVNGKSTRVRVCDIRESGRNTSGVRLMEVQEGDRVASAACIQDPDGVLNDVGHALG